MKNLFAFLVILLILPGLSSSLAHASNGEGRPDSIPGPDIRYAASLGTSARASFPEDPGGVQFHRWNSDLQAFQPLGPAFFGIVNLRAERDFYDFPDSFGGPNVNVGNASRYSLGLNLQKFPIDRFGFFALGVSGFAAEDQARLLDGFYAFGGAGINYRMTEDLVLGLGVAGIRNMRRNSSVFPLPFVWWRMTDNLLLQTRNGILLEYQQPKWNLTWETLYESRDWALGPVGDQSKGAFQDRYITSGLRLNQTFASSWNIEVLAQGLFFRKTEIRGADRQKIDRREPRPTPYFELTAAYEF